MSNNIQVSLTAAEALAFLNDLERALDCPMIQEDDCFNGLDDLRSKVQACVDLASMPALWALQQVQPYTFTIIVMRKIEKLMNVAIKNNTDWRMSNTEVTNNDGVSTVYLHGNKIAEIGDAFVRIFDGGWQSNTTKSRLNAIINEFCCAFTDGVYQHKFEWFITDNKCIHKFVNGYTFSEFA